ncbi:uncharacterized protein LOC125680420 [Ostrea edulis]|uniref:uncharacterized protein LOC125680420 n=1 Tax=Ostrea edulis TaxID=37623 RepID=UPI0024AF9724|nr:uncharacterized protein LOC125680420 [Ostrea edulis]
MRSISSDGTSVYEEMGFSLAASVFGGILIVPIVFYGVLPGTYILSSKITLGINVSTRMLGLATMIYMVLSLVRGRRDWILSTNHSLVRRIRLGFLWVFCVLKCTTSVMHSLLRIFCLKGEGMPSSVIAVLLVESSTLVSYAFLQMGFITYTRRYIFYNLTSVKCVTFIVALSNIIEGLTSLSRHISEDMNGIVRMYNCSFVSNTPGRRFARAIDLFRAPISLEFSILATTVVLALRSGSGWTMEINRVELIATYRYFRRRIAMVLNIIISVVVNLIILVTDVTWVVWPHNKIGGDIHHYAVLTQKGLALLHVLIIHYCLFKKLNLQIRNTMLNFNDISLLIGAAAVVVYIMISHVIAYLDVPFVVLNFLFTFYQTNFLLYGRRIAYAEVDNISSYTLKGSLATLIGINMTSWFNNSFFTLINISRWKPIPLIKDNNYILYMIYPFLAYFRFQSSMELLEFYRKI